MIHWGSWIDYKLPDWVASTAYAPGELIAPGNGHKYIVTANTGTSGTVKPTFPTGSGATLTDSGVTWQEAGLEVTYLGDTTWNGGTYAGSALDHFAQNVNKKPSVARFGAQWLFNSAWQPFSTWQGRITDAWNQGMITLLDWGSWDLNTPANNESLNYANILTGTNSFGGVSIDSFLNSFAAAAAAYGKPFVIRMWHEFNADGGWTDNTFPWCLGNVTAGGNAWNNSEANHKAAWQKIVNIFRANGATNVAFMWCPNILATSGATSVHTLANCYPGSTYVDWIALDGYAQFDSTSLTFQDVFRGGGSTGLQDSWALAHALDTTKPMAIAETNADPNHNFAARGTWYHDALETYAPDVSIFPNLGMLTWFMWGWSSPADLPVDQDGTATGDLDFAPFKRGIQQTSYLAGGTFTMPPNLTPIGAYDVTKEALPFDTAVKSTGTPMAWWKLNESAGAGSVADSSGRAHPGTPQAGVTLGAAKVMPANGALAAASFNGSAVTGYIEVASSADLSLAGLADAGIVTSFVVPNLTAAADILGRGVSGEYEYEIQVRTDGGVELDMYNLGGASWTVVTAGDGVGPVAALVNVPQFVGAAYVGANSPRAHAWLNPASVNAGVSSSDLSPTPAAAAGTSVLRIGQRPDEVRPLTSGARVGPTVIFSPAPNKFSMTELFNAWNAAVANGTIVLLFED